MSGHSAVMVARSKEAKAPWAWHLGALACVVGLILLLFRYEVADAIQIWWIYPTYSHCFLIIPISAWLVWEMRHDLARNTPSIAPKALLAVPPLLLLWLAGNLSTINEVRQFAVVALIEIAILAMLGARIFRAVLFPALYLFFLVPFGQYLIPPMQAFATSFTDAGLNLLSVPHYTEGTTIELTTGRFEIAEACAGLRFLIATLALGVLFAHLAYRKWYKTATFLAACIVVPLIGNGLRCLGIIELAHLTNNRMAVGADHLIYGWAFNTAILLTLLFAGLRFRDDARPVKTAVRMNEPAFSRASVLLLAVGLALAIGIGPAFALWHEGRPMVANARTILNRFKLDGWTAQPSGSWHPVYPNADMELVTGFTPASSRSDPIDVAVEYYARNREGRSLIAATNRLWDDEVWHEVEAGSVNVRLGSESVRFDETILSSPLQQRLVWSSYWMDGRFTTRSLTIKILQLKTAFTGNEAAALVAFSIPVNGAVEDARARLRTALAGIPDLPDKLVEAGRTESRD